MNNSSNRKKDEKILKRIKIKFKKDIPAEYIQHLYLSVGWQFRECSEIKRAVEKSFMICSAWEKETLVGLARATGDGIYSVTIWDFAIKPAYQNMGIGKLLLNSLINKINEYDIPLITLYSELDKKNFYSKLGFECDSKKIIGMYRYNSN